MTEVKAQKWFAKRQSTKARTDEDAAMAYMVEGPFPTEGVAHVALADMLRKEVEGWREHKMDASRDERALARVVAGETDVTEGNVRWFIVEITGNPLPTELLYQCDVHGITTHAACCCELARCMGSYEATEQVCCAHCEERIADPRHTEGRGFGQTSPNGAVCMPCVIALTFANEHLTETQSALLAWLISPSADTARRCKRATARTHEKLIELGLIVATEVSPFYAPTIAGRRFAQMRTRDLPLAPPATLASHLVEMAASASLSPAEAETITANELADAIERGDERAADYHRAVLDEIAKIKRIVISLGGHWR